MVREPDRARTLLGPHVAVLAKDAFDLVSDDLRGFDVIIDAFSTAPAQAYRTSTLPPGSSLLRDTQSPADLHSRCRESGHGSGSPPAPDGSSHVSTTRSDLALCQVIFFSAGSGGTTVGPVRDQPESNTTGLLFASFAACWRPSCRAGWALSRSSG
jgi:hypothetical protein